MRTTPLGLLYHEHDIILDAVALARDARKLDDARYAVAARKLLSFFRLYADRYHHRKEEEILFPAMAVKNELAGGGIVQEMLEHHAGFRDNAARMEKFLDTHDYPAAREEMARYVAALTDHIAVENDEVFPMAESLFSSSELEAFGFRFNDSDRELGETDKAGLAGSLADLRDTIKPVLR
jgi:hemerythrin-like domain-containing protein